MPPLPAHQTKSLATLSYLLHPSLSLTLTQSDSRASTTGSTLWLGAQLLSLYLISTLPAVPKQTSRPRALELGAGIGLTSLALSSLGYDVLATDVGEVVDRVLHRNVEANVDRVRSWAGVEGRVYGCIAVKELDWFVEPEKWRWDLVGTVTGGGSGGSDGGRESESESESAPDSRKQGAALLGPPFDLVVTSDTLYMMELVEPLLRTLLAASLQSQKAGGKTPLVLVALEVRDKGVIDHAVERAKECGFECKKVPESKVKKCMNAAGLAWAREDWEGVEIWRWKLKDTR